MLDLEIVRNGKLLAWFDSPLGRKTLAEEAKQLSDQVRRFHGDTLVWCGPNAEIVDLTRRCMVRSRVFIDFAGASSANKLVSVRTKLRALPIAKTSVDGVVLHHALDFAEDPRLVIREAVRILAPGGRLLVCGFNPYSLWGLRRLYAGFISDAFTDAGFVSVGRLGDWLAVLGFQREEETKHLMYRPPLLPGPFDNNGWQLVRARVGKLPFGGVYVLEATKMVLNVRPPDVFKAKSTRQNPLLQQRARAKSSFG